MWPWKPFSWRILWLFSSSQNEDLSKTREALVAAETSQNHLQQRADDLSKMLEANLEKLSVYERRPSGITGAFTQNMEGRSREEQLEAEVAELKYVTFAQLFFQCSEFAF